jgi:tetratricopeptide (TPR) repeat protein
MNRATFLLAVLATLPTGAVQGEPFLPTSDKQVIERLPYKAGDPVMTELRAERAQLRTQPQNIRLALRLASRYIELGRINGDPRYAGYAQSALMPWWNLERPPKEVLLLRANLRQHVHDFEGALSDLDIVLQGNPWNAQARLTRATVLQVQGRYAAARDDCFALRRVSSELIATACLTGIAGVTGHLRESLEQLSLALERNSDVDPSIRGWVLTGLAEMADRAGLSAEAESHFQAALRLDPGDFYLLGAYTDFLLDQHRAAEAARLLADKTRADPLLLRYVLALKAQRSPLLPATTDQLRERFDASRLRGDRVHLREEARFTLHVLDDAPRALQLARENWVVQKEVADVRILLEAALACDDEPSLAAVHTWLSDSKLEDVHIQRLTTTVLHPDSGPLRTSRRQLNR